MFKKISLAALSASFIAPAFAAGPTIDVSGVTDSIASGVIAVGAMGAAVLGFMALRKVWRLVNASV